MLKYVCLLVLLGATTAHAQFVSPGASGGSSPQNNGNIRNQPDNATDTFSGLTFQVQRIVKDPAVKNGLRLIMRVIETEKEGRRVSWIQPAATVTDEVGNIYQATQSTGVPVCIYNKPWDMDGAGCARFRPNTPSFLTPSQPAAVVLNLAPAKDSFSADLAAMARKAAFNARIGIFSQDLKTVGFYDVVINGIELPEGGN